MAQDHDAVSNLRDDGKVMRDVEGGGIVALDEAAEQGQNLYLRGDIECRCGFVQHEYVRAA